MLSKDVMKANRNYLTLPVGVDIGKITLESNLTSPEAVYEHILQPPNSTSVYHRETLALKHRKHTHFKIFTVIF